MDHSDLMLGLKMTLKGVFSNENTNKASALMGGSAFQSGFLPLALFTP